MVSVCLVTLQDHVIKVLNDIMVRTLSRRVTTLPSLVAIDFVVVIYNGFSLSLGLAGLCDKTVM